jgi:hypothetical protein
MLSLQRRFSNAIFLNKPNPGKIAKTKNAQIKFTPRETFCST